MIIDDNDFDMLLELASATPMDKYDKAVLNKIKTKYLTKPQVLS